MRNIELFRGNNDALISSISALLALDAKGALAPNGIGEMARNLLETCAARLPADQNQSAPKCKACGDTGVIDDKGKDELPSGHFVERGLVECTTCTPSAPVEPAVLDDRTSFEAAFPVPAWAEWSDSDQSYLKREDHICSATALAMYRKAWQAWQGARAGLTTWKRRAIEAESKLRTYDPRVVEMSAQAMDALFVEPKPKEFVLTKCKLCVQLQAELTERDELIDQLRSGCVFETGPYQVELTEEQWTAALGVFENYNMGDDQHFVFLEEHGRGVISEILIEIGVARAPDADEVAE